MGPSEPLMLPLRPSVSLTAFLLFGHLTALSVIGGLWASWPWLLLLIVPVLWSLVRHLWRFRQPSILFLEAKADGSLFLQGRDGLWEAVAVEGQTTVMVWLIVLLVRTGTGKRHSLVLPVDALGRNGHRLLRRWLLWRVGGC